ncbi:hypothetical protein TTHERM_000181019 (macronuclear) [Tetrahymena thermophila SB210]|uniref:Uncharacterized protein n=1 Tax=Tetrahymena thermophila (strain SB210) TaxID=312017 RepID=W7XLF8_TETTS|nr:hypothetical protein TTHERM_000181019 [Tetrahymena thermophila SB210]EWS76214.1 hypothetical protein TTHERM_000181019 [Tetrahymena thermophila SB210]|eukprot:XP_012651261.1 hypothetical protein TTHERM_000181019 [Tetrahymena thermophila SB210]
MGYNEDRINIILKITFLLWERPSINLLRLFILLTTTNKEISIINAVRQQKNIYKEFFICLLLVVKQIESFLKCLHVETLKNFLRRKKSE